VFFLSKNVKVLNLIKREENCILRLLRSLVHLYYSILLQFFILFVIVNFLLFVMYKGEYMYMCVHIYVYIYIYIYVYKTVCVIVYIRFSIPMVSSIHLEPSEDKEGLLYVYLYVFIHIYLDTHIHMYVCMYTCV
jgi:hypothetical protein